MHAHNNHESDPRLSALAQPPKLPPPPLPSPEEVAFNRGFLVGTMLMVLLEFGVLVVWGIVRWIA